MYNSRVTLTLRRSHSRLQQLEGSSNLGSSGGLQRSDSLRAAGSDNEEAELPRYHFGVDDRPRPPLPGAKPRLQHSVCPSPILTQLNPGLALLYSPSGSHQLTN